MLLLTLFFAFYREELIQLLQLFDTLDTDGSGSLNAKDLLDMHEQGTTQAPSNTATVEEEGVATDVGGVFKPGGDPEPNEALAIDVSQSQNFRDEL